MADYTVAVTAHGLVPAVLYIGTEGSAGKTILFQFSDDWDGFTKEVIFFDNRGNAIVTPCVDNQEVPVPAELTMYGGPHKYTVRGFTLDDHLYIDDQLQVTGTITTTYTAGHNPRLEGRIIPSTLDLFLAQADAAMKSYLRMAKISGEFDAKFGEVTADAETLNAGEEAEAYVVTSGPNGEKNFAFTFKIPAGDSGVWVSDSLSEPPSADQNLWALLESGDNYLWIPDGLATVGGKVYLTVDGQSIGEGIVLTGKNFTILGHYDSLEDLEEAVPHPAVGDAYGVGDSDPYDIYLWDGEYWDNYGSIGANITVDTAMSSESTNPVQNRIIKAYVDNAVASVPTVTIDDAMSDESENAVQNKIIKAYVDSHIPASATVDTEMSDSSENAVQNQVIKAYVDGLIGDVDTAIAAINAIIGGADDE